MRFSSIPDGSRRAVLEPKCDLAVSLMGKIDCGLSVKQKVGVLTISAKYISKMHNSKVKEGIG